MDMSVKEFLDFIPNPNTKKCYRLGIKRFCEWFGKTPLEVLNMRKVDLTQRSAENLIDYRNRAKSARARTVQETPEEHIADLQDDKKRKYS